jgi:hypothetical protein
MDIKFSLILLLLVFHLPAGGAGNKIYHKAEKYLRREIISGAEMAMNENPETITSFLCPRSSGGKHDFYSEGDYWWPDPENPDGPYIQRDGMTNPDIFTEHRRIMIRFSTISGLLASAYRITGDEKYVKKAFEHFNAWFSDTSTMMYPSLCFAQAIKGRATGRGTGIIDTIHLIEVAQAILVMENAECIDRQLLQTIKSWFGEYLKWLMTHQYSIDEMNTRNNHASCWVMQVASFARLTGDDKILDFCRERYMDILLPDQMAADGSFPEELRRTKPYGYSLFNLDAFAMICLILTDSNNDLFSYMTNDGKSLKKGIEFIYPFVTDKNKWPFKKDVMYWDNWPVAHPFLLFGSHIYKNINWFNTWKSLDHFPANDEVIRNLPVRNPVIWMTN